MACSNPFDNSSDGLWIVSTTVLLLFMFMFMFVVSCHVDHFDLTKLAIFRLLQIWQCALNWFIMELVHKPKFDTCHLHGLGATYPKHGFFLSLCAKDFQLTQKFY